MVVERRLVARCNGEWCQQGFRALPGACRTISGLRSNAQDSERSGELAAEGDGIGQVPFIERALGLKSRPTATLNHITTFSLFLCLQHFLNSYLRGLSLLSPLS